MGKRVGLIVGMILYPHGALASAWCRVTESRGRGSRAWLRCFPIERSSSMIRLNIPRYMH